MTAEASSSGGEASAAIVLEAVSRAFRDFWGRRRVQAVDGISLAVPRGEIFGLLGPNGSGKTTLLSLILGLLRPDAGRIEVLGGRPGEKQVRVRVGYLPEEFAPPDHLSGEEVLGFYGSLAAIHGAELRARIDELLELLELGAARRRRFRHYSKGMRRRIGLAQALLHDPDLILLDEPTNGLDPLAVRRVKSLLEDLRARGKTILVASHILPELEEVCDRIAILHNGVCLRSGATRALLERVDRYELILEERDGERLARARALLEENGYAVDTVRPLRRSLEALFLETVARPPSGE